MTYWTQPYELSKRLIPEEITGGKRLGFLEELVNSFNEATLVNSQFGAEKAFHDEENENIYRIRQAGGTAPDPLGALPIQDRPYNPVGFRYKPYTESWRRATVNQGVDPQLAERNADLTKLQQKYPNAGILTYDQIMGTIRDRAAKIERRAGRDATTMGDVGWFIGGAAGGVDPRVNPVNFLTLPLGGFGKSIASRIITQAGGQGIAEAISQYTGVRENQQFLTGHLPTGRESAAQIALATAAGAGGQALGEGLGFLGRKWFRNVPNDPAPPVPPRPAPPPPVTTPAAAAAAQAAPVARVARHEPTLSVQAEARITQAVKETLGTGRANVRTARADFAYVRDALDRWDGPEPWRIPPNTSTRIWNAADTQGIHVKVQGAGRTVDDIAREIDPETFRVYDNMQERKVTLRDHLAKTVAARQAELAKETEPLQAEIASIKDKLSRATKRNIKKLTPRLAEAEAKYAEAIKAQHERAVAPISKEDLGKLTPDPERNGFVTPEGKLLSAHEVDAAVTRHEIQQSDFRMRDLAPAVSRAYARAQGSWAASQALQADIDRMFKQGGRTLTQTEKHAIREASIGLNEWDKYFAPSEKIEVVPELAAKVETQVKEGADAADVVTHVTKEREKVAQESYDALAADATKILADANAIPQVDAAISFRGKIYTASDHSSAMEKIRQKFNFDKKVEQEMDALGERDIGFMSDGKFTAFSETQAKTKGEFTADLKAQQQSLVVPGYERRLMLDDMILTDDGPKTVKAMLDELTEINDVHKAVTTCSAGSISSNA
jgi:hypothetical protein